MSFYKDFLYIPLSFLIIYLPITRTVSNKNLNVIKSGQAAVNPCSIGINFFTILNNTSESDYFVELLPDECCIDTDGTLDCDSMNIIGECVELLPKGKSKTLNLVAPTVSPLERKGFCTVHVDSRPVDRKTDVMRDTIKIKFDTTIRHNDNLKNLAPCKHIDEDPLNDCKPVNCERYYNGVKNFFDKRKNKCVATTFCNEDESYDVNENDCKKDDSITETDLDFLKSIATHGRSHKNYLIIKTIHGSNKTNSTKDFHKEDSKIEEEEDGPTATQDEVGNKRVVEELVLHSQTTKHENEVDVNKQKVDFNINGTKDEVENKTSQTLKEPTFFGKVWKKIKHSPLEAFNSFKVVFKANKFTIVVLLLVILLQCCLLVSLAYYLKCCGVCCEKKKVKCQFFNYRQDASITTPLIGTSNIDTETTGFNNYVTESSYIDNKIKCYKACQKQNTDSKLSMPDDILTKCLNRRDWNIKVNSETALNFKHINFKTETKEDCKVGRNDSTVTHEPVIVKKEKVIDKTSGKTKDVDVESCKSETEIQCHEYNLNIDQNNRFNEKTASLSTEKGAQACFSNDSVDDFLSEKGSLLFGDNNSKYSLNFSSPERSSYTEFSSKTSKNNIIRHFISFLSRKSKVGVNSEPGKASKDKLELLHMSKASLQSSCDSNVKKLRNNKFFKESRSTF